MSAPGRGAVSNLILACDYQTRTCVELTFSPTVIFASCLSLSRIRTGGSPIMPTSARERGKLQCKQTMDKYTCQVKAVLIISS